MPSDVDEVVILEKTAVLSPKEILGLLKENRVPLGRKPLEASAERETEAKRLTSLFRGQRGFSFVRLGDFDLAFLLAAGNADSEDLFPGEKIICGTNGMGGPGLRGEQAHRMREAVEKADYLDSCDWLWKDDSMLKLLALRRPVGSTQNPSRATSYILPAWLEHEFKNYCQNRRVLFCGAEAPLLEELLKYPEFLGASAAFWPGVCESYFLRPRDNGRNLAANLDAIKADLSALIIERKIDTLFLSLGGGAKILCYELAKELRICAIDFGAFLRSLTYSGSDGNRAARSTHAVFLFHVPFNLYMDALEKVFPGMNPEELLAKAHAQLLLELHERQVGWSYSAWDLNLSAENKAAFRTAFDQYKRRYHKLFNHSAAAKKERADFLHFCGTHDLTFEGRLFLLWFNFKALAKKFLGRFAKN